MRERNLCLTLCSCMHRESLRPLKKSCVQSRRRWPSFRCCATFVEHACLLGPSCFACTIACQINRLTGAAVRVGHCPDRLLAAASWHARVFSWVHTCAYMSMWIFRRSMKNCLWSWLRPARGRRARKRRATEWMLPRTPVMQMANSCASAWEGELGFKVGLKSR